MSGIPHKKGVYPLAYEFVPADQEGAPGEDGHYKYVISDDKVLNLIDVDQYHLFDGKWEKRGIHCADTEEEMIKFLEREIEERKVLIETLKSMKSRWDKFYTHEDGSQEWLA